MGTGLICDTGNRNILIINTTIHKFTGSLPYGSGIMIDKRNQEIFVVNSTIAENRI